MKKIFKTDYNEVDALVIEAINLHKLRLAAVQRLFGVCVETRMIISYYVGKTLKAYMKRSIPFVHSVSIFLRISGALRRISREGYAHNDIKGDNVCVRDETGGPKATVIDLGNSRQSGTVVYPKF